METQVASGNKVLAKRRDLGLSQEALAQAGGVTRQAIGAIEGGRTQPGVALALAIARTLNTSVEELFGVDEDEEITLETGDVASPGQRVIVATVGDRSVIRSLDWPALGSVPEPAQAIVMESRDKRARLRRLEPGQPAELTVLVSGCDLGLGLLVRHLDARKGRGIWFSQSNQGALAELAAGRTHIAAIHGPEAERRKLGPARRFDLAQIEEGWLVARGNPLGFRGARDFARGKFRLANRPSGAGARALLDAELRRVSIEPRKIPGYERELGGHLDVARAVSQGFADVGVGIASAARMFGLEFIALRSERCTLLIPENHLRNPAVAALVETLRSGAFRRDLEALGPYDTRRIGEEIA
jgi:molybdate-binding protein/DNA-binding XRE family transcriptional regulator